MSKADDLVNEVRARQETVNAARERLRAAQELAADASIELEEAEMLLRHAQYQLHLLCGGNDWKSEAFGTHSVGKV